jgi:hypothetical protein
MSHIPNSVELIENLIASKALNFREVRAVLIIYKLTVGHQREWCVLKDSEWIKFGLTRSAELTKGLQEKRWININYGQGNRYYRINEVRLTCRPESLKEMNQKYYTDKNLLRGGHTASRPESSEELKLGQASMNYEQPQRTDEEQAAVRAACDATRERLRKMGMAK